MDIQAEWRMRAEAEKKLAEAERETKRKLEEKEKISRSLPISGCINFGD